MDPKDILKKAQTHIKNKKAKSNPNTRGLRKGILGVVIVILLAALGMEVANFDLDLGSLLAGESIQDSRVYRTWNGADCEAEAYNCADFTTQGEAQNMFKQCGGLGHDVHVLDADDDGEACEELPQE